MSGAHQDEDFKGRFDPRVWRRLVSYLGEHRGAVTRLAIGGAVIAAIEAALPLFVAAMIDEAHANGLTSRLSMIVTFYLSTFIAFAACVWMFIRAAGEISTGVGYRMRQDCFRKLQELSFSFFDTRPVGWLTSRLTSDCGRISGTLPWVILDLFWGSLLLAATATAMLIIHVRLSLIVFSIVPVLIAASWGFQRLMLHSGRQARRTNSAMTASYNEALQGARTTKTLVREERNLGEFQRLSTEMRGWMMKNSIQSSLYFPVIMTIGAAGAGLALWKGGGDYLSGEGLTLGRLVAFLQFAGVFAQPIQELAQRFADILNASTAAERVVSLLDTTSEIRDHPTVLAAMAATHAPDRAFDGGSPRIREVRFEGVSFWYKPGVPVLTDFNLHVREGQTVALVGATGGGKSTIVSLMARFYEPREGSILLDGIDYRERSLHWLQSNLGVIQQVPHLFSGSIRENIRYGRLDASDAEIETAAKRVNAHDFILSMEKGYDFDVGECGERLSTGQRQLVALARAVLRNPQIFIMDEATSSVDTATERLIQGGIEEVLRDRIAFVIAHRLSTIRRADVILVIDGGRIVEQGTHRELLAKRSRYFELYTNQYAVEREAELFGAPTA
ncbi:MAG: ABC transporter ATP-binding protein [Phycisphaerae bacterium]|jgi:ATP-binding cassette subfamily B protein|nr:ABC transporter ATP-binding protein [Phycisphaerae bacterium]